MDADVVHYLRIQRSIFVGDAYKVVECGSLPVRGNRLVQVIGIIIVGWQDPDARRLKCGRQESTQDGLMEKDLVKVICA